jgi:hypothetical protein
MPNTMNTSQPITPAAGSVPGAGVEPTLRGFLKEKWPELLIVAILLPIAGVLFSMKGDVSKLDGTVNGVVERVQHIAEAIPDLRIKVAYEATEMPFNTLILTGKLYKKDNKNVIPINIIDTSTGERALYLAGTDNSDQALWALSGVVWNTDESANSFTMIEKYSVDAKKAKFSPDTVDKTWSFVAYKKAAVFEDVIQRFGYVKMGTGKVPPNSVSNWSMTVDALRSGALTVDQPTSKKD